MEAKRIEKQGKDVNIMCEKEFRHSRETSFVGVRSNRNIYAQIIDDTAGVTLVWQAPRPRV